MRHLFCEIKADITVAKNESSINIVADVTWEPRDCDDQTQIMSIKDIKFYFQICKDFRTNKKKLRLLIQCPSEVKFEGTAEIPYNNIKKDFNSTNNSIILGYFDFKLKRTGEIPNAIDKDFKCIEFWAIITLTIYINIDELASASLNIGSSLATLLDTNLFSDVTIVSADNQELPAHKNILSARSKVFAAMFSHQLEETKLNRVEIADFDADVIKEMLQFIYTDKSPNMDIFNGQLLAIADKYELSQLTDSCFKSLIENINIENAMTTLALAELHRSRKLFDVAVEFIKLHEKWIIATESWKNIFKTNGELVQKYLQAKYELCVEITTKIK